MSEDTKRAEGKPPHLDRLSVLWRRLNEHKIVQWSVAYVALAYAIQHGVILTSESFEWPNLIARISMLLLVLGLPLVITFAWYHGARASRNFSQAELSILAALLVMSSLLFYVFVRPAEQAGAPSAQQAGVTAARNAAASAKGAISLAVLPFVNLSSDKEQEFFSDGMTEEITSALSRVPDLRVVGRTSAFQFKGQNQDLRAIGQSLAATHLIEGSVRKAGDRVRITVQLIKSDDGTHIWSEDYDRQLTDVFAIQEDIARAITASLRMPLGLKPGENLVNNRSIDSESYQQYLRATSMVRARGLSSLTEAVALLEQTIARHPDFAPAWSQLALAYGLMPNFGGTRGSVGEARRAVEEFFPKAEAAAQRAIQLDPGSASGYVALARAELGRRRHAVAEDMFKKALALDPNNPDALSIYANLLADLGRVKEALTMKQQLQGLETLVPIFNGTTAMILWLNGQNDAAIEMMKALPPGFVGRADLFATIYASMGRYHEAADALLDPYSATAPPLEVKEAARLLRTAPTVAASPEKLPRLGYLSFVYLYVGARDRALEPGETDAQAGNGTAFTYNLWHPIYGPLRKTERFKALMRAKGLPDYWKARGWPEFCHPTTGDDFACT